MSKRIFFVSSGRLCVYLYDGQVHKAAEFRADERDLELFDQYLLQPSRDPVYVVVDFVEEEFREDSVPHVLGRDRQAVLRTKLSRLFRDNTYVHALLQGRSTQGRRDDRMLFTSLIRPDLLAPWMAKLAAHKVPVAGVYSLPLISGALIKALKLAARNLLLVTLQSSGGLRQTYFVDGELKLSRLAMLPDSDPKAFTPAMLGEVERVRRYLNSLRMLPSDEPLDVCILAPAGVAAEVELHAPESITARPRIIPLVQAARRLRLKGPYEERYSDRLFAQLLARRSPANQYAPQSQTRYFRLHRLRRGLVAASVFLLMGGLAWSASTFVDGVSAVREVEGTRRQADFYQRRYEQARARLPRTPTDSRNLKRVVEAAEQLDRFRTFPLGLMQALSSALEGFPGVQLDELQWRVASDVQAPVDLTLVSPFPEASRAGRAPATEHESRLYQVVLVTAHVSPFDGDYRAALGTVRRLAERLRGVPGVEQVHVESLPLDIGPRASLSGDVRSAGVPEAARFQLRLALREAGGRA
jgi:hypothetical protein